MVAARRDKALTDAGEGQAQGRDEGYRVLARKYRPQTFEDLIGQEAMVRTLSNAFASGRVAHGFILTGVRGVGKTTTARIIARGLNCIGPDGTGGPTVRPCGVCEPCRSIAEGRNIDVLEMDAASRTGIDDIREIIDSVRYRPAACRFKVYIIDEVHMLSRAAFNGLLKTLEEPPPHVKFIFATTEIRKVPVTVLSRCQRFDLRRIEPDTLAAHLGRIAEGEGVSIEDTALGLLARAGEGSARDAVSLLDQAMAYGRTGSDGRIEIGESSVRDMLGLADRSRVLDLFEAILAARTVEALEALRALYADGADPGMVINDLLDITHGLTRIAVAPDGPTDPALSGQDLARYRSLAEAQPVNVLTRAWQMLLKGLEEVGTAPNALAAAEMVVIRMAYAASLKTPDEVLKLLDRGAAPSPQTGPQAASASTASSAPQSRAADRPRSPAQSAGPETRSGVAEPAATPRASAGASHAAGSDGPPPPTAMASSAPHGGGLAGGGLAGAGAGSGAGSGAGAAIAARMPDPEPMPATPLEEPRGDAHLPATFEQFLDLTNARREIRLETDMRRFVHLVSFEPRKLQFRPAEGAPQDLSARMAKALLDWTGERWMVSISNEAGAPTLISEDRARAAEREAALRAEPLVAATLALFPGAHLGPLRALGGGEDDPADETSAGDAAGSDASDDDQAPNLDGDLDSPFDDGDDMF